MSNGQQCVVQVAEHRLLVSESRVSGGKGTGDWRTLQNEEPRDLQC